MYTFQVKQGLLIGIKQRSVVSFLLPVDVILFRWPEWSRAEEGTPSAAGVWTQHPLHRISAAFVFPCTDRTVKVR